MPPVKTFFNDVCFGAVPALLVEEPLLARLIIAQVDNLPFKRTAF